MKSLPKYLTNIDSLKVPETRKLAKKILKENKNERELLQFAKELLDSHSKNKVRLGINLMISLSAASEKLIEKQVKNLADNEDWELREEAAQVIRSLLERNFDKWFPLLKEFINSKNTNLKRAAVIGSMATGIKSKSQVRRIANEIYEPVLGSSESYIRINLGPFAFGAFFLRLFPDIAFEYFDKWIRRGNEWTRWNVLMAFSASRGREYPDRARNYIEIVKNDQSPVVQKAIKSVSKKIGYKDPCCE